VAWPFRRRAEPGCCRAVNTWKNKVKDSDGGWLSQCKSEPGSPKAGFPLGPGASSGLSARSGTPASNEWVCPPPRWPCVPFRSSNELSRTEAAVRPGRLVTGKFGSGSTSSPPAVSRVDVHLDHYRGSWGGTDNFSFKAANSPSTRAARKPSSTNPYRPERLRRSRLRAASSSRNPPGLRSRVGRETRASFADRGGFFPRTRAEPGDMRPKFQGLAAPRSHESGPSRPRRNPPGGRCRRAGRSPGPRPAADAARPPRNLPALACARMLRRGAFCAQAGPREEWRDVGNPGSRVVALPPLGKSSDSVANHASVIPAGRPENPIGGVSGIRSIALRPPAGTRAASPRPLVPQSPRVSSPRRKIGNADRTTLQFHCENTRQAAAPPLHPPSSRR